LCFGFAGFATACGCATTRTGLTRLGNGTSRRIVMRFATTGALSDDATGTRTGRRAGMTGFTTTFGLGTTMTGAGERSGGAAGSGCTPSG
jgi:hypothetical protein